MRTIYKYRVPAGDSFELYIPAAAEVLCVQTQNGEPYVWVLMETSEDNVERYFRTYGTGHRVSDVAQKYIGTFQINGGAMVFHVFEEL